MICPDWRDLVARHDAETLADAEWHRALAHSDECPRCAEEALAAEPTLLFRGLPALAVGEPEVREMQQAVAGMRRNAAAESRSRRLSGSWLRAAAVAAVLLGAALLQGTAPMTTEGEAATLAVGSLALDEPWLAGEAAGGRAPDALPLGVAPAAFETHASALPLVEMADPAFGSIIEVVDQDITVVVVMPENRGV